MQTRGSRREVSPGPVPKIQHFSPSITQSPGHLAFGPFLSGPFP